MATRTQILSLYKSLMRESQKFAAYNFRSYAVRRVRDAFKQHKLETDPDNLKKLVSEAYENLEVIKRQAVISRMYQADKLVIENVPKTRS